MQLSLSIVIPTLNEASEIADLLKSLAGLRAAGVQIIVADGGSLDETRDKARDLAEVIGAPRGRARQMNAGAARARGEWLLFLHADTRLPGDAVGLLHSIGRCERAQWGYFPVRLTGHGILLRIIERMISWRSRVSCIGTGDQALFVRRSTFDAVGGFADIPLMEDIALCKQLRKMARPVIPNRHVTTSSRRWEEKGVLPTVLTMWALRAAYACGVSPQRLVRLYYGKAC
jgi:rSAM/selenodomain-associated transferase 2